MTKLPNTSPPLGSERLLSAVPPTAKMHPPHSYTEATSRLKIPFPGFLNDQENILLFHEQKKVMGSWIKPEHIQRLYQILSKPLKHCRVIAARAHVFVGRTRVKGRYEKYLELYLAQRLRSHKSLVAAKEEMSRQSKLKCATHCTTKG